MKKRYSQNVLREYEMDNGPATGWTNYKVRVRGSSVVAYLAVCDRLPSRWQYSLWTGSDGSDILSTGTLDMSGLDHVTPEQVARAAFILDVNDGDPRADTVHVGHYLT